MNDEERGTTMKREEYIQTLLDRYLDGMTTAGEEAALRQYFAKCGDGVPEEWRPYRALFAYVDDERHHAAGAGVPVAGSVPRRSRMLRRLRVIGLTAAAAVALLLVVVKGNMGQPENYVVIDGKVYTDRHTVKQEALDALQIVSSDYDDSFDALEMMK